MVVCSAFLGDQAAALLNSLRISSLSDSVEHGTGSPFPPRAAKNFVRAEPHSTLGRDFGSQPNLSPSEKRASRTATDSLIKQDGHEQGVTSQAWRKPNTFVQSSGGAMERGDDPFVAGHGQAVHLHTTGEASP